MAKRIVRDVHGNKIVIKQYQEGLRTFPSYARKDMDDDGVAYLSNIVHRDPGCGCSITGCGTLQFPLMIKFCKKHEAVK
jgi:hypothetical protein